MNTVLKVILTYHTAPRHFPAYKQRRRSIHKTDAGIEDARSFAAEWAAKEHVATVHIYRGRTLLETIK